MRRGEIWTVSGGADYAGKPRPVVIVQDDRFDATESVTVCGLTTTGAEALLARPEVIPSTDNGSRAPSRIMIDKITTVPKRRLGQRIGVLGDEDIGRLNRAVGMFLGLAGR